MSSNWHLITGEYPPQPGGVSDYTHLLAHGVADAGESVTVWCPPAVGPAPADDRVAVRRELGVIGWSDLRRVGALLDAEPRPRRLLVQWVPHAFSRRAINYPFCRWIHRRAARHGDRVDVVVHEAFMDIAGSLKQRAAAIVQRLMLRTLLKSASQVWVTIPAWEKLVRPHARRDLPIDLLPVPSNIPVTARPDEALKLRNRLAAGVAFLIGHFGTYGGHTAGLLQPVLEQLFGTRSDVAVVLLGRNGDRFRAGILSETRISPERLIAPGSLTADELSNWLTACDLFIQPYAGGISSRNGSLMACLAHGRPVVANLGKLTEPFWQQSNAIALAPEHDVEGICNSVGRLLSSELERRELGRQAELLYHDRFDLNRLVRRLTDRETKSEALCESH